MGCMKGKGPVHGSVPALLRTPHNNYGRLIPGNGTLDVQHRCVAPMGEVRGIAELGLEMLEGCDGRGTTGPKGMGQSHKVFAQLSMLILQC